MFQEHASGFLNLSLIIHQSQGRTKSLLLVKLCPFEFYFGPWIKGSPMWINIGFIFKLVLYIVGINLGSYILEWHFGSRFNNWKSLPKSIFDFWFRIRISPKSPNPKTTRRHLNLTKMTSKRPQLDLKLTSITRRDCLIVSVSPIVLDQRNSLKLHVSPQRRSHCQTTLNCTTSVVNNQLDTSKICYRTPDLINW